MTTEEHLGRFYIDLQAWIDGGCGEPTFWRSEGICPNLERWAARNGIGWRQAEELLEALERQFAEAGYATAFPFNLSLGNQSYGEENLYGTIYTNPARLAWIKEHAEAAKATGQAVAS